MEQFGIKARENTGQLLWVDSQEGQRAQFISRVIVGGIITDMYRCSTTEERLLLETSLTAAHMSTQAKYKYLKAVQK